MEEKKEIFKKITKPEEREKLLTDLCNARAEILCKGVSESVFRLKAAQFANGKLLCALTKNSPPLQNTQENWIANFSLGGDKYFFQGDAHLISSGKPNEPSMVYFSASVDLFHLQRRQNYRIKMPASYHARFEVTESNGKPTVKNSGQIDDLSGGGCRVHYAKLPDFKTDDVVRGKIFAGGKDPIEVTAKVRHIKTDAKSSLPHIFGFEFEPMNAQLENRMFTLTMELHRQFFSRLK